MFPTCTSTDSTVLNPTSFTITADPSFFSTISVLPGINTLLALLGQSLEEDITYTLSCSVNGQTATFDGTFTATTNNQSQTVNLQDGRRFAAAELVPDGEPEGDLAGLAEHAPAPAA